MRRTIGRILLGFAGGFLLSRLRAMPGGEATEWAGVESSEAMAWRAAALLVLALASLGVAAGGTWVLLASIALGFATHGFAFGPTYGVPWILLALLAIVVIVGRPLIASRRDELPEEGAHPTNLGERAGLWIAGAGVAIGIEAIARHLRLFGAGLAQDDSVFGAVFLAFLAFGAAAFGWMVSARSMRRLSFPVALAAASAACFASLSFVDVVADGKGLRPLIERWNMRPVEFGTLPWDVLLAAAAFIAPALFVGAGLAGARGRGSWSSALVGAAVGLFVMPRLLDASPESSGETAELFSAQLVPIASLVTLVGAALAALSESKRRPRARYVALFLIALCGIPALTRTPKPVIVLSPWAGRMIMPFVAFERGTGLATVEPSQQGIKVATLDRHELTPDVDGIASDHQRIADSFALLSAEKTNVRVLFVGQLTPLRATALTAHGATKIDRTAAWWKSMKRLEKALFEDQDGNPAMPVPEGDILSPRGARERVENGDYDIVIALPLAGDAPAIGAQSAPSTTTVVRWLALENPLAGVVNPSASKLAGSDVAHAVVISADGLVRPSFGIATNATQAPVGSERRVRVVPFERDRGFDAPWTRLGLLPSLREDAARVSTFRALAEGNSSALGAGLARFHALQAASPPFERGLTRFELDSETLSHFARAADETPLDPFLRTTWSWLARALVEKRDVTNIDRFLPALVAAHAPWSELEIALAHSDLEAFEPQSAAKRLEAITAREDTNWPAWFALGEARELTGDLAGAAQAFKKASELVPTHFSVRRRLAMALVRAADPSGHALVVELLVQHPKDDELPAYLGPEAPPPAPKAYTPTDLH
ncbi:MAG: hypothetical protein SGI72_01990 [Planctomycetota bacterium]|nr:hypothetical protein [Planctomycetota bacterium]